MAKETDKKKETRNSDGSERTVSSPKSKKYCSFCESKKNPSYTDSMALRRFMSDRSRIVSSQRTGACSKHQRKLTKEIKYARHLALLPFITRT